MTFARSLKNLSMSEHKCETFKLNLASTRDLHTDVTPSDGELHQDLRQKVDDARDIKRLFDIVQLSVNDYVVKCSQNSGILLSKSYTSCGNTNQFHILNNSNECKRYFMLIPKQTTKQTNLKGESRMDMVLKVAVSDRYSREQLLQETLKWMAALRIGSLRETLLYELFYILVWQTRTSSLKLKPMIDQ
uniref:Uncharacterized protein n=1 Tax=Vespula pensylvanica TaxID=30213 RepID=A0A834NKH6_VESPE|nr:hypothetical protein H0235_012623 [Vespula pensylvanica]